MDMNKAEWTSVGQIQVDHGQYPVYGDLNAQSASGMGGEQGMYGGGYDGYHQGMGQ
jgi:hypothetical protein